MRVEALQQCDVTLPGKGHPNARKRALFPGQAYELPDETNIAELLKAKKVAVVKEPAPQSRKGGDA